MEQHSNLSIGWKYENGALRRELMMHERIQYRMPSAVVTMAAEITTRVSHEEIGKAIQKLTQYHPLLRSVVRLESDGRAFFEITELESIPLVEIKDWTGVNLLAIVRQQWKIPFDLTHGPLARIIWIQHSNDAIIMVMCHHVICDGLSLVYLLRDLLLFLSTPSLQKPPLSLPPAITYESAPETVKESKFFNFVIKKLNKKWAKDRKIFRDEEYIAMLNRYWSHADNTFEIDEFSPEELLELKLKCRQTGVKLNTALTLAFHAAIQIECDPSPNLQTSGFAVDIRDKMRVSVGESMGLYAGAIKIRFIYKPNRPFWQQAQIYQNFSDKSKKKINNLFQMVRFNRMNPGFLDMISFAMYGGHSSKIIQRYLSKKKMGQDRPLFGFVLTNLGRLSIPTNYERCQMSRLLFIPGASDSVKYAVGVVTLGNRLVFTINWRNSTGDAITARKIIKKAKQLLFFEK